MFGGMFSSHPADKEEPEYFLSPESMPGSLLSFPSSYFLLHKDKRIELSLQLALRLFPLAECFPLSLSKLILLTYMLNPLSRHNEMSGKAKSSYLNQARPSFLELVGAPDKETKGFKEALQLIDRLRGAEIYDLGSNKTNRERSA